MFHIMSDFPDDVLAVRATGKVSAQDYNAILVPAVEAKLKAGHRPLKVLVQLGEDFEGYQAGAMVEDARLGFQHLKEWGRIAVVTDVAWIRDMTNLFRVFLKQPLNVFFNADFAQAKVWISQDDAKVQAAE